MISEEIRNAVRSLVGLRICDVERLLIEETLKQHTKRQTAIILDIALKTLYNRLNEYEFGRTGNRDLPVV
jgi:transcriptional regulator with PAS, ATPase and Fis domain